MADLPSEFWGGWIVAITVASFIALLWLVIDVYRGGPDGNEHEVWDETLREGAKPAPIWWFWFILALMTISVIYVMLYPGLGTWRGALGWSQGGRIAERFVDYDAEFGAARRRVLGQPLAALASDGAAMRSAWRVFNNNCSSCHGRDAAGQARQFPDLTDSAWQWGADETQIVETIHSGRQAAMPGWLAVAGEESVGQIADYVLALSRGEAGAAAVAGGGTLFQQFCMACHGSDGAGNPLLGAPALNDAVWTYGGERAEVIESIATGRNGTMPAFGARLDATQIRLLAAWLKAGAREP
ncbi:MAG TPA: cytochrome-c oxidase, cbb3-type subunit III [Steroidobacteraceae bacterium]